MTAPQFEWPRTTINFHAPDDVVVEDITGNAGVENVADALMQNELDRCTRVSTAKDDGKGVLTLFSARAFAGRLRAMGCPATNRALPSRNLTNASAGDIATLSIEIMPKTFELLFVQFRTAGSIS